MKRNDGVEVVVAPGKYESGTKVIVRHIDAIVGSGISDGKRKPMTKKEKDDAIVAIAALLENAEKANRRRK